MQYKRICVFLILLFAAAFSYAQDSLSILCPLPNGSIRVIRSSDKTYEKTSEYGVMLSSRSDTAVQACHEGQVVIVARTEDKKYDVVLLFKGYYFWYAGVLAPKVKVGMRVKPTDLIGTYAPGDLLELLLFYNEEPVNPRKYLKCK